ncbi:DNA-binding NtrC family response regulator OS=Streptomyces griseomycini OX=66895 GN=FHS37_007419 PE=4 SV=1 [Streptomyces griseomycini]
MRENDPDRALRATMESFLAALESSVDTDASLAQVYAAQSAGPVSPDQYSVESRIPFHQIFKGESW